MYLELKPQNIGTLSNIDGLLWSHGRDFVPPQLANFNISLAQWQQTFDATENVYKGISESPNPITGSDLALLLIPCTMCCGFFRIFGKAQLLAERTECNWAQLQKEQSVLYAPYGIAVCLAKELVARGAGSHRHLDNVVVGLKLDLAGASTSADDTTASCLVQLNNLHKTGALTQEEFTKAKQRVLGTESVY